MERWLQQPQFPFLLPQILNTLLTFLTPKKEKHFFQGVEDLPVTVKQFFTWPFCTFRERTTKKIPILDYTVIYLCSYGLDKFCFFVGVIKFILKFYSLFHINFSYSKVVFHQLCIILSHINFQYLNFMEH